MSSPKIHIGTAGWDYKDWIPGFYAKNKSSGFDWLEFYSEYFNTVEVNSTYYTYLNPKIVEGWLDKTKNNDDFIFIIKLHQDFTHKRYYSREQIQKVKFNLDILAAQEKLAGILIQFPYSFECNSGNIEYLRKLISDFEEYNKFVEIRHNSWKNKKASTITFCTIDQPVIGKAIEFSPVVGNNSAYIRFHGRNEDAWKMSLANFGKKQTYNQQSERYNYLYSPGELAEIERKIKEIFDQIKQVFIIANNHPNGNAVVNAFELMHLLGADEKISIPEATISQFPRVKKIAL